MSSFVVAKSVRKRSMPSTRSWALMMSRSSTLRLAAAYEWNGESFINRKKEIGLNWINPSKRERKEQSYSMDKYYRNALMTGGPKPDPKPRVPRAPKQQAMHDYQFFDPRLGDLQDKETAWFSKENNIKAPSRWRGGHPRVTHRRPADRAAHDR